MKRETGIGGPISARSVLQRWGLLKSAVAAVSQQTPPVPQPRMIRPPVSGTYVPAKGVPPPKPASPIRGRVPEMGFTLRGYAGEPAPVGSYGAGGMPVVGKAPAFVQAGTPAAGENGQAMQAAGRYATGAMNYLANLAEFQRRVGDGDVGLGRQRAGTAAADLASVPIVNERARIGSALAHTRDGSDSYVSFPSTTIDDHKTYRRAGKWLDGAVAHEMFHPFTVKTPGYIDKIEGIQRQEGVDTSDYYHHPREQAAEMNAVRAIKGAWPGRGAGEGGKYTPEQANDILDEGNPYFRGLPVNYKMRLLNEARNRRIGPARRGVTQRVTV